MSCPNPHSPGFRPACQTRTAAARIRSEYQPGPISGQFQSNARRCAGIPPENLLPWDWTVPVSPPPSHLLFDPVHCRTGPLRVGTTPGRGSSARLCRVEKDADRPLAAKCQNVTSSMNPAEVPDNPPAGSGDSGTWRILDAALNRAKEGLRVVEDHARMVLNDRHLTELLKQLRHDLTAATTGLDPHQMIAQRDTQHDVGTEIETGSEFRRDDPASVVHANLARLQQSLRTIEEYAKPVAAPVSRAVEKIRYRSYTIEKAIVTVLLSSQSLRSARLCVLVDACGDEARFARLAESLVAAGADLLQLRDKRPDDRTLIARGEALSAACQGSSTRWIMNDRADIALAAGAHGVHLGQSDLPVAAARRILGPAKIIGVSTHSMEQARAAVLEGANYIGVGPVFASPTKSFDQLAGTGLVRGVAEGISLPAFAVGGITASNLHQVLEAGMQRIAVSSAVHSAGNPAAAVRQLKALLSGQEQVSGP